MLLWESTFAKGINGKMGIEKFRVESKIVGLPNSMIVEK